MDNITEDKLSALPPPQAMLPFAIASVSFLIDIETPNDIGDAFLYLLAVVSCTWVPRVGAAPYTAASLMLPMILGYFVSPPAAHSAAGIANRVLGTVAMGWVALIVWRNARLARDRNRTLRELERLHDAASRAGDAERVELSRWLHEGLAQELAVVGWALDRLARNAADSAKVRTETAELRSAIDGALKIVHRKAVELRKPDPELVGLPMLVERYATDFARRTGLPVLISGSACLDSIPLSHAILCLSVVQEALTNVAKHAAATEIRIECRLEPRAVRLAITDDGRGIDASAQPKPDSLGLLGLHERLNAIDGSLRLTNIEPRGTLLEAKIPIV